MQVKTDKKVADLISIHSGNILKYGNFFGTGFQGIEK